MKKLKRFSLILLYTILIIAGAIFIRQYKPGTAPIITYDGSTQIKVGSSKLQVLFDDGFASSPNSLPRSTWDRYGVSKDNLLYGNAYIKNESSGSSLAKSKCRIFGVWFSLDDEKERGEILVNGVNFKGCSPEEVKAHMSNYKLTSETNTILKYKDGIYTYEFKFKDGIINTVTIKDNTDAR